MNSVIPSKVTGSKRVCQLVKPKTTGSKTLKAFPEICRTSEGRREPERT